MEPLDYCRNKVAPVGSALYYALRFAPPAQHDALLAVHALDRELDEIPDEVSDAGVGEVKLQWWREELQRAFDGRPRHPVSQALAPAIAAHGLDRAPFDERLEGVAMDLAYDAYPSFRELTLYGHRSGGALAQILVAVAGGGGGAEARFAHDLGMAFTLRHRLLRVRDDAHAGRIYLPQDELAAHGVAPQDLLGASTPPALRGLLRQQAERITEFLDSAEGHLPPAEQHRLGNGMLLAAMDRALLAELAREDFPLLERRIELTPLRRLWIAWRTARRQRRTSRRAEQ